VVPASHSCGRYATQLRLGKSWWKWCNRRRPNEFQIWHTTGLPESPAKPWFSTDCESVGTGQVRSVMEYRGGSSGRSSFSGTSP